MGEHLDLEGTRKRIHEAALKKGEHFTQFDLHRDYEALGGDKGLGPMEDWLRTKRAPKYDDVVILCEALKSAADRFGVKVPIPQLPRLVPQLRAVDGVSRRRPATTRRAAKGYIRLTGSDLRTSFTPLDDSRRKAPKAA